MDVVMPSLTTATWHSRVVIEAFCPTAVPSRRLASIGFNSKFLRSSLNAPYMAGILIIFYRGLLTYGDLVM